MSMQSLKSIIQLKHAKINDKNNPSRTYGRTQYNYWKARIQNSKMSVCVCMLEWTSGTREKNTSPLILEIQKLGGGDLILSRWNRVLITMPRQVVWVTGLGTLVDLKIL